MLAKRGDIVAQALCLCCESLASMGIGDRAPVLSNNWQLFSEMHTAMSQQDTNEQLPRSDRGAPPTRASDRASAQRKKSKRMLRTIFLGTVAMIGGVFWLGDQYGVDRAETLNLLVSSAGFVVMLALAGLVGAGSIWLIRRLFR